MDVLSMFSQCLGGSECPVLSSSSSEIGVALGLAFFYAGHNLCPEQLA